MFFWNSTEWVVKVYAFEKALIQLLSELSYLDVFSFGSVKTTRYMMCYKHLYLLTKPYKTDIYKWLSGSIWPASDRNIDEHPRLGRLWDEEEDVEDWEGEAEQDNCHLEG